jgi:hypothetical protein
LRLVLTLLVRDEEDILDAHLRYHFAAGVDYIVATDNGSTDKSCTILEQYVKRGLLHLIREPSDDYSQGQWVTRMARLACTAYGADWVINSDADEFWWPSSGDLKATLESICAPVSVVSVRRFNFLARPIDDRWFFERMLVRQTASVGHPGYSDSPMVPKVCHRAHAEVVVAQGNHSVRAMPSAAAVDDERISILHYPIRSFPQLRSKIKNGGEAYERNTHLSSNVGHLWRELLEVERAGKLAARYRSFVLPEKEVAEGIVKGTLTMDTRVSDKLKAIFDSGNI